MKGSIYVVDDDADTRDSLEWLLDSRGHTVKTWEDGQAFFDFAKSEQANWSNVAVILLDIRMERMSGLATFEALKTIGCPWPVVFLTGHGDVSMAVSALQRGARDFIEKPLQNNQLVDRLEDALDWAANSIEELQVKTRLQSAVDALSGRELQVLSLVSSGNINKVIADKLDISQRTVEFHKANIFQKLEVTTAAEVARLIGLHRITIPA